MLDSGDSFFARQRPITAAAPGRRYVGICAHGLRLKAAEARLAITVLAAAQRLFDRYGALADPYMTLVAYFGSLRELAGMRRLLDDDVRERLPKAAERGLGRRRSSLDLEELTSRRASEAIPLILNRLAVEHRPDRPKDAERPLDVVLATNMISVGVDVQRLGLMMVVGQPKATAEYIQATSRIGRDIQRPGIVFTLYNWARPRDLSHYEHFEYDHATFYRQVEALSVTPFAARACDRVLTAILVALTRHEAAQLPIGEQLNPDSAAQRAPAGGSLVGEICAAIAARAGAVTRAC